MHNICTHPCLICKACNTSTWTWILLQWIWGTPNTNNLYLDLCSLSPSVEMASTSFTFLSLPFMTSHDSLPRAHSSLYYWRTLMKFRDSLNFSTRMIFIILSAGFFFVLIFTKWSPYYPRLTGVSYDTSHQCASSALWYLWFLARWITLLLSQWIRTEVFMILNV